MKLLAVDVGNTEIKRALIQDGEIGVISRDATSDYERVAKEIAFSGLPVALCSVRKQISIDIKYALKRKRVELVLEVTDAIDDPVSGFYSGMGADRIADISAAWSKFDGKPVLVVGLGTATTCTAASSAGKFKGGFITLGLGSICSTLTEALPELPAIDPRVARSLEPGFDVYSSICRGTVSAHVAIIEGWVKLFKEQLGSDMVVVATGGWCEILAPLCSSIDEVSPELTLRGIWTLSCASGWTSFS